MTPFFVTCLPRSRSGWCANWLTTDTTLCHHDVRFDASLTVSPKRVGFAGPELIDQMDDILKQYPESPWLVLLRPLEDCLKAFNAFAESIPGAVDAMGGRNALNNISNIFHHRAHKLAVLAKHGTALSIDYMELNSEGAARAVWNHLLPGIPFDLPRWKLLCKLNVQQQKPKLCQLEQSQQSLA